MDENWASLWEQVGDTIPDATAVVQGNRRRTYREVEQRAARLATALDSAGVGPGGKVAILAYNCIEYLETTYATFKLRGSPVNLNYRYRDEELLEVLDDCDADVLVFHGSLGDTVTRIAPRARNLRTLIQLDDGSPLVSGAAAYESLIANNTAMPRIERSGDDVFLLYTGGTTGRPRGVVWRHADIISTIAYPAYLLLGLEPPQTAAQVAQTAAAMRERGTAPVILPAPPMIHGTAFYLSKGAWMLGGCVVILESRSLDAHELWRAVEREAVTQIVIVGDPFARAMVLALEEAEAKGRPYDLSSVRQIASSGVLWSTPWKQALASRGSMTLTDLVGASEGGPYSVQTIPPGSAVADCPFRMPPRAKLIDDDGRIIEPPAGHVGRLAVAPPHPVGYYKDDAKTATLLLDIDGVVHTMPGDYARVTDTGEVVLLGRGALCINTGGEKVYPHEVEDVISQLPGVIDVNVVGLPDPDWGEVVTALVATDGTVTTDQVREAVRDRLAGYKVPKHVAFTDRIHRTPAGKARYPWALQEAQRLIDAHR